MNQSITVITPTGRLDAARARPFGAELQQQIVNGAINVLVDFKDATYISSHGLRVLLMANKQARQLGGAVKLCGLNNRLLEIFELAGFNQVLEIFETREQAETSFK